MIDWAARKQMGDVIRAYMNDEIKSDEFSDALDAIDDHTEDRTINVLVQELWYCYDDLRKRRIRHWILEMDLPLLGSIVYGAIWLMFAPVALLLLIRPEVDSRISVVIPRESEEPSR